MEEKMECRIGIIGFGVVGEGFFKIIKEKEEMVKEKFHLCPKIVLIFDPIKGCAYGEKGINMEEIQKLLEENKNIKNYKNLPPWKSSLEAIEKVECEVIVEATPTNLTTGEPGFSHIKTALENGKNVITTNKGPIALHYETLNSIAQKNNKQLKFEGTVLAGTPLINMIREGLTGTNIKEIKGIFNGTTNFILTKMSKGIPYEEALKEAQRLGFAETDPTNDVEGWDVVAKVVILGNTLMGGDVKIEEVKRKGITGITSEEIEIAQKEGKCWKLVGRVWKEKGKVFAEVTPTKVKKEEFLGRVEGVMNGVSITTDVLERINIVGPGAGGKETGYAIFNDLINIYKE